MRMSALLDWSSDYRQGDKMSCVSHSFISWVGGSRAENTVSQELLHLLHTRHAGSTEMSKEGLAESVFRHHRLCQVLLCWGSCAARQRAGQRSRLRAGPAGSLSPPGAAGESWGHPVQMWPRQTLEPVRGGQMPSLGCHCWGARVSQRLCWVQHMTCSTQAVSPLRVHPSSPGYRASWRSWVLVLTV